MSLVAGLAVSTNKGLTFDRVSRAPILKLTDEEPFAILTAPCVLKTEDSWRMWYVSGVEWVHPDLPRYNIKHAESENGISWRQSGTVCIDFKSPAEAAIARPCVLYEEERYKMWYSYKTETTSYRIGYAESGDGLNWERKDEKTGIRTSESGWDSEMVEYAFVFNHLDSTYMLYNGNEYGANGIGLAILEKEGQAR